jgi:hypothetical protein
MVDIPGTTVASFMTKKSFSPLGHQPMAFPTRLSYRFVALTEISEIGAAANERERSYHYHSH